MATRFILGPAASGKTHRCITEIASLAAADPLGPPIFYVVPKQATFSVQRRLACAGGLPGFTRVRVLSFELLAEHVLAECGGEAIPTISARGRRMILTHLLREHADRLVVYRSAAGRVGLAQELDNTFADLERNGYDESFLVGLIEQLSAENPPADSPQTQLIGKLRDLRLLYDSYHAFLGQDRIDPHRRLRQVMSLIRGCDSVRRSRVFVDGHLDFADFDRKLIAQLALHAADVTITMLVDTDSKVAARVHLLPEDDSLFHRTELAYRRLHFAITEAGVDPLPPERLPPRLDRPIELQTLERTVFRKAEAVPAPGPEPVVTLCEAPSRREEVKHVGATVREWMRDHGMRPREIAVLCRDPSAYHDLLEAGFAEQEIPCFLDRRRSATHHPLLRLVRGAVQAVLHRFSHGTMMALLKSGLCGLSRDEADELENYILRHNIAGPAWTDPQPWAFTRSARRSDDDEDPAASADAVEVENRRYDQLRRRVMAPLTPLRQIAEATPLATNRDLTAAIFAVVQGAGADRTLSGWIEAANQANQLESAAEHEQVWGELTGLCDELVDLLGDEETTFPEFAEILETAISGFDLAITPPTLDQVIVGDIERTRFDHFKGVILVGWNEGEFPVAGSEATIIGDHERRDLLERRIILDADSKRKLLDESLLAYLGVTRATQRLCITRPIDPDDGRIAQPSPYWREVVRRLPRLGTVQVARGVCAEEALATRRDLVQRLARWARTSPDARVAGDVEASWYQAMTGNATSVAPISAELRRAWDALSYDNAAALAPATARQLFGNELHASVTRIEAFARCPYHHFMRSTVRVQQRLESDVSRLDLGNLYHQVLERLVEATIKAGQPWNPALRPPPTVVRSVVDQLSAEFRGQLFLSTARNRFYKSQAITNCDRTIDQQYTAGSLGTLQPLATELAFGPDEDAKLEPLVVHTPAGRSVVLSGKIDRVDWYPQSGVAAVFDYKLGQRALKLPDVYHGLALQLLTYLLVVDYNGQTLAGRKLTPLAAFYVHLSRGLRSVGHPSDAEDPSTTEFVLGDPMSGLFREDGVSLLDTGLPDAGAARAFKYALKQDGEPTANSDCATREEFDAVLKYVRAKIADLADRIIDGDIAVRPYRMGKQTPCPNCEFRAVCRFDPSRGDRYLLLDTPKRAEVMLSIMGGKP